MHRIWIILLLGITLAETTRAQVDTDALPTVEAGFAINFFAKEPHIINPSALCFDRQGRLFVGAGPQYRNPKPDSPTDYIKILIDDDGDGVAETVKTFADGFNSIQSLAWRGEELWVANSPDLTVLRDTDGDDVADEYQLIYTGLNNLRHGLHGFNWGPDGWLYMAIGNTWVKPNAPKPFRDIQRLKSSDKTKYPLTKVYSRNTYPKSYHSLKRKEKEGGIFRCRPGGQDLELFARGMRNPWDMCMDDGFNWLATDNDPGPQGDRIFMPIRHGHYSMRHPWKFDWNGKHPAVAPVADLFPTVSGSGTGVAFYNSANFPEAYRGTYLIADWTQSCIYWYQPKWEGAHQVPAAKKKQLVSSSGGFKDLQWQGGEGRALFRPTDIEIGPDGALYIAGWGSVYGTEYVPKSEWTAEENAKYQGRVFRFRHTDPLVARNTWDTPKRRKPLADWSYDELLADLGAQLPVWRVDAQDELIRRGAPVREQLLTSLKSDRISEMQATWAIWAVGRIEQTANSDHATLKALAADAALNQRIQAARILGAHEVASAESLLIRLLDDAEPRVRHAAIEALGALGWSEQTRPAILAALADETDRVCAYSAWQIMRRQLAVADRRALLDDPRPGIRRMAALGLAEEGNKDIIAMIPAYLAGDRVLPSTDAKLSAKVSLNAKDLAFREKTTVTVSSTMPRYQPATLLRVDLGCADDPVHEPGWIPWELSRRSQVLKATKTFDFEAAQNAKTTVTLETTTPGQARNYGLRKVTNAAKLPLANVWRDQVFFNNNTNGSMTLTFNDLSAGNYRFTGYGFANNLTAGSKFNDEGNARVVINEQQTAQTATFVSGHGSKLIREAITAAELHTHARTSFDFTVAEDTKPVRISFQDLVSGDTFGLNGFELAAFNLQPSVGPPVHYTTDGSVPTAQSPQVTGPLSIRKTAVVKAAAFVDNARVSEIAELQLRLISDSEWKDRLFVTDLSNGAEVLVDGAQRGVRAYADTPSETITEIPADVAGGTLVRMPKAGGPVSFSLNLAATVHIAASAAPDGCAITPHKIRTSSGATLSVFKRDVQPGKLSLTLTGPHQIYVAKTTSGKTTTAAVKALLPEADLKHGEEIFFGRGTCFVCHKVQDRGIEIGPGLVGISQRRDTDYIIKSILEPDVYIVEGYQQTSLKLKDGRELFGMIQEETALSIKLALLTGELVSVEVAQIAKRDDAKNSGMPSSFIHTLSSQDVADITAWIMQLGNTPKASGAPGSLSVDHDEEAKAVAILIDGQLFTEYRYGNKGKPILYPVIGPHGIAMTRHHPMKKGVAGEALDHPHHQSIHYNHPVNGHDFWHGRRGAYIRNDAINSVSATAAEAVIISDNSWIAGSGERILTDTTEIRAGITDGGRYIDYQITVKATDGNIRFEETKEGTMSIRTHPALRLKGTVAKGQAINSEGVTGKAIWGKQAKWVDYWGPIEGKNVGIAIFDHPSNPRHPTTWHARDYGLIAANPFGKRFFKAGQGAMTIKSGDTATFRYRFYFHAGSHEQADIPAKYQAWSAATEL